LAIFLAFVGWVAPGFLIQQRAEGRLYRVDRAMPELIDLLVVNRYELEAIGRHDAWLVQFPLAPRYDRLRQDPRAAALLARLGTK